MRGFTGTESRSWYERIKDAQSCMLSSSQAGQRRCLYSSNRRQADSTVQHKLAGKFEKANVASLVMLF